MSGLFQYHHPMRIPASLLLVVTFLIGSNPIAGQITTLKLPVPRSYRVLKTNHPVIVDGFAEETWENVPWTDPFIDIEGDSRPRPYYDTRVKMLWDDEFIYFFAQMEEEHWAIVQEISEN